MVRRHETTQTELDLMRAAIDRNRRDTAAVKLAAFLILAAMVVLAVIWFVSNRGMP